MRGGSRKGVKLRPHRWLQRWQLRRGLAAHVEQLLLLLLSGCGLLGSGLLLLVLLLSRRSLLLLLLLDCCGHSGLLLLLVSIVGCLLLQRGAEHPALQLLLGCMGGCRLQMDTEALHMSKLKTGGQTHL